MDPTISVSKGCFVFKNGATRAEKETAKNNKLKQSIAPLLGKEIIDQPFYKTYSQTWKKFLTDIEILQRESYSQTLKDLIDHIGKAHSGNGCSPVKNILPAAALLTGINQPDHHEQFETLSQRIKEQLSASVCVIQSRDCPSVKAAVETMVYGFVEAQLEEDEDRDHKRLRRSQCTMQVLTAWHKSSNENTTLVVVLPDFECFNAKILQDFILILSSYCSKIPIVLVLGVATAVSALHSTLPYHVTSKIRLKVFQMQAAPAGLNELVKAEIMDVDIAALELQEAQISALTDIRKKLHIAPAFSVEFIGYYLDRISRVKELKCNLEQMIDTNTNLLGEQQILRDEYDSKVKSNTDLKSKHEALQVSVREIHKQIVALCPSKTMPTLDNIGRQVAAPSPIVAAPARPMSVPTAAALKMGVGFPLAHLPGIKDDTGRVLSTQSQNKSALVHECGICKRCNDQHLLAKCDTCHFHYHLGCLNPPLTRHPKKSKLYGWQCSECDKSDDSDAVPDLPKGPRKSRTRFSKDGTIVPVDPNLSSSNPETSMSPKSISPVKRRSTDTTVRLGPKRSSLELNQNGKPIINLPAPKPLRKSLDAPKKIEEAIVTPKKPRSKIIDYSPLITHNPQVVLEDALKSVSVKKFASISNFPEFSEAVSEAQKSAKEDPLATTSEEAKILAKAASDLSSLQTLSQSTSTSVATILDRSISLDTSKELHNKNRKKRSKDKHKSKYSSDNEKSPSKEHKRKRKKKNHDSENPNDNEPAIPKIKIKFKTLPLPGEAAPEAHFFYVSADMLRSRPASVETVEDLTLNVDDVSQTEILPRDEVPKIQSPVKTPNKAAQPPTPNTKPAAPPARQVSPRKANKRNSMSLSTSSTSAQHPPKDVICDVCKEPGTPQNLVLCDECHKNYHFTCLDPPLKKTPKRRGYSWHCADCDPTDNEQT